MGVEEEVIEAGVGLCRWSSDGQRCPKCQADHTVEIDPSHETLCAECGHGFTPECPYGEGHPESILP